jgi:hypothetical protein
MSPRWGIVTMLASERLYQSGLADPRLATYEDNRARAVPGFHERGIQNLEIRFALE